MKLWSSECSQLQQFLVVTQHARNFGTGIVATIRSNRPFYSGPNGDWGSTDFWVDIMVRYEMGHLASDWIRLILTLAAFTRLCRAAPLKGRVKCLTWRVDRAGNQLQSRVAG